LAGPVVAAAVILDDLNPILGLNDSKKLTAKRREALFDEIRARALCFAVAEASVQEIDQINILQATLLAMKRAVEALRLPPKLVLVDGNRLPTLTMRAEAIVQGDALVPAISAASVVKHANSNVVLKCMVLHTVVADDEIGIWVRRQQSLCGECAFASDKNGNIASLLNQQRLIASICGLTVVIDFFDRLLCTAISPGNHPNTKAFGGEMLHQTDDHRGFACAAGHHVTDNKHRHRQAHRLSPSALIKQSI
jgi:hypothetical protein